jgi:hypothetical protein
MDMEFGSTRRYGRCRVTRNGFYGKRQQRMGILRPRAI